MSAGWCCVEGTVFVASRRDCESRNGFFSFDRAEALKRCQTQGWCCKDGRVFENSPEMCKLRGGFFSHDLARIREWCRPGIQSFGQVLWELMGIIRGRGRGSAW